MNGWVLVFAAVSVAPHIRMHCTVHTAQHTIVCIRFALNTRLSHSPISISLPIGVCMFFSVLSRILSIDRTRTCVNMKLRCIYWHTVMTVLVLDLAKQAKCVYGCVRNGLLIHTHTSTRVCTHQYIDDTHDERCDVLAQVHYPSHQQQQQQ